MTVLDPQQPLPSDMHAPPAQITADPSTAHSLRNNECGPGSAEEIGNESLFVRRGLDDPLDQVMVLLCRVPGPLRRRGLELWDSPDIVRLFVLGDSIEEITIGIPRIPQYSTDILANQLLNGLLPPLPDLVQYEFVAARIEQNVVVRSGKAVLRRRILVVVVPDDRIAKAGSRKHFVQQHSELSTHMPVAVNIDASRGSEQIAHEAQPVRHHGKIRIEALTPSVSVRFLLHDGRLLVVQTILPDGSEEGKVRSGGERGVDVDQVDSTGKSFQEGTHDQAVVAPDQFVLPTGIEGVSFLPGVGPEQAPPALSRLPGRPALPHGFDDLEGKTGAGCLPQSAGLVVLAGPDQLGARDLDFRHLHSTAAAAGNGVRAAPLRGN